MTDEEVLALPNYQTSPLFSELDKVVLDYAVGMSRTPVEVSDELFDRLQEHFDEGQLIELTHHIALENMRGRFNLALGIGSAGFSEGMVYVVPAVDSSVNRIWELPGRLRPHVIQQALGATDISGPSVRLRVLIIASLVERVIGHREHAHRRSRTLAVNRLSAYLRVHSGDRPEPQDAAP